MALTEKQREAIRQMAIKDHANGTLMKRPKYPPLQPAAPAAKPPGPDEDVVSIGERPADIERPCGIGKLGGVASSRPKQKVDAVLFEHSTRYVHAGQVRAQRKTQTVVGGRCPLWIASGHRSTDRSFRPRRAVLRKTPLNLRVAHRCAPKPSAPPPDKAPVVRRHCDIVDCAQTGLRGEVVDCFSIANPGKRIARL